MNHAKIKKARKIVAPIVLLIIIACSVYYFSVIKDAKSLNLQGTVETEIYSVFSEVNGKIIEISAERGQEIKEGDLISLIDDSTQKYVLTQLEQTLIKKEAAMSTLKTGADSEQIKQSQNNVTIAGNSYNSAKATYENILENYNRTEELFKEGVTNQASLDTAKLQLDSAKNTLNSASLQTDNAKQQLSIIRSGAKNDAIRTAQADIDITESQIKQANEQLEKYIIKSPVNGIIISKNYLLGDVVAPGFSIVDIASNTEKFVTFYVPVKHLARINYGQKVAILYKDKEYTGDINYIDVKSEYTPKEEQTSANKNKESIKVKVSVNKQFEAKPGEYVKVRIGEI